MINVGTGTGAVGYAALAPNDTTVGGGATTTLYRCKDTTSAGWTTTLKEDKKKLRPGAATRVTLKNVPTGTYSVDAVTALVFPDSTCKNNPGNLTTFTENNNALFITVATKLP